MHPAPDANNPLCAEVMVRLPDRVDGEDRRWTDAQATAAWGSPAKVLFTCGVEPPGPTTLDCVEVSTVDWIIDDSDAPRFRMTTYGRTPAVELFIDTEVTEDGQVGVSSRTVLDVFSPILRQILPRDGQCIPREEATLVPSPGTDE